MVKTAKNEQQKPPRKLRTKDYDFEEKRMGEKGRLKKQLMHLKASETNGALRNKRGN